MGRIHPTAIIEPNAQIDTSVEIGSYSTIGQNVTIDARTTIGSHSIIEGHTTLGKDNRIGHYVSIGGYPQDMKYRQESTRLEIGHRNTIREFVTIHVGTVQDIGITSIGDDNCIMTYVHIGHDCRIGSHVILSSNSQMAGHVKIGDWVVVGGMSGIHQFVRIGQHAMLGGASSLVQDIPPYIIASGNKAEPRGINIKWLHRRNFSKNSILALRRAYQILYKSNLLFNEAKEQLHILAADSIRDGDVFIKALVNFIDSSQRGIIR
ncbi:MAG: acyl-ACP--UDP-N-acetylglucosamine O-acyltransferase [Burkholderia sp.]|nr:acyl-ACP--UDP-N-acetylglucosamine O-acyltransferase [Burkholderia sp.]